MRKFNFELLLTARQLRQLTQKEVAEKVNVSQASLSKAEHGIQGLPAETMKELSDFYDLPLNFFECSEISSPIGHLYYRKKITISDKIIDSFIAKVRIYKMIVDNMMSQVELPEYSLNSYCTDNEISAMDIAHKIRYELKIFRGPVPNLATLLENNGIIIIRFDFGTSKIDGLTTISDTNRKIMFINSQMPNDRIRFSMAHELGHLVMHLNKPPRSSDDAEREADEFASEFLTPKDEIKPMLLNLNISTLSLLKRRWRVSMKSLIRKSYNLGVISYAEYRNFQIYFSKYGYTKDEPITLPIESPTIWDETLNLYKKDLGYSDKELMSIMKINESDYNKWFTPKSKIFNINTGLVKK